MSYEVWNNIIDDYKVLYEYEKEKREKLEKENERLKEDYMMLQNASDKREDELIAESTNWESKFYDEAKKVDKAIEYIERYMFSQKENYDYIHLLDILKGVDKE